MKSKDNSPSNDFQMTNPQGNPLFSHELPKKIQNISSKDSKEENITENQEGDEENDFIDFNISFFLPKDQIEKEEKINKSNNIVNNILNVNQKDNDNDLEQNNEIGLSKKNDNNDIYLNLNQKDFPTFKNIYSNFNTNNEIKQEFGNNNSNIEGNEIGLRYNFNKGDNFFSAINNYNNYFINPFIHFQKLEIIPHQKIIYFSYRNYIL